MRRRKGLTSAFLLAAAVACIPQATLAQRGGGGHVAGGGHVSSAPSHVASSGHIQGGHAISGGVRGSLPTPIRGGTGFSTGSRVWIGSRGTHLVEPNRFEPRTRLSTAALSPLLSMMSVPVRRRFPGNGFFFFGGGCFDGFFPEFCSFGPGLFESSFWPTWGWDNDGFAFPESFGYPFAPSMSDDIEARVDNQPQYYESAPFSYEYQYPPAGIQSSGTSNETDGQILMLYLTDGTVYALTNYWVADGKLHYVTSYGGENTVDIKQVDVQHTVDVNAKRGVKFTLKPQASPPPSEESPQKPNPQQP